MKNVINLSSLAIVLLVVTIVIHVRLYVSIGSRTNKVVTTCSTSYNGDKDYFNIQIKYDDETVLVNYNDLVETTGGLSALFPKQIHENCVGIQVSQDEGGNIFDGEGAVRIFCGDMAITSPKCE